MAHSPVDPRNPPWDLSRIPNYAEARSVERVDPASLSEEEFYRELVFRNRPCLFPGALDSWPASEKWASKAYLSSLVGNLEVRPVSEPLPERFGIGTRRREQNALRCRRSQLANAPTKTFREFIAGIDSVSYSFLAVHPLDEDSPFAPLLADLGSFPFIADDRPFGASYPRWAAIFYKRSFTDWHYHPRAEALMCQVVGSKEVLLLPADPATWAQIYPIARELVRSYEVDLQKFPNFARIRPFRVTVNAGDALYIPTYWWHIVQAADDEFGATLPTWFASPRKVMHDPRYPGAWQVLRTKLTLHPRRFLTFAPAVLLDMARSVASRGLGGR